MTEQNNAGGGAAGEGGTPPAGGDGKTAEQRLAELEKSQTKLLGQLQATSEELKRVNGLNNVLLQRLNKGSGDQPDGGGRGMDVRETVRLGTDFSQLDPSQDPEGFAKAIVKETANQVRRVMTEERVGADSAQALRKQFFETNKDLVGFEIEVGHFANEVQAQMPYLQWADAQAEVAKRTREYIKSRGIKTDAPNPPPVLPTGANGGGPAGDGKIPVKGSEPESFDPEKAAKEDMEDYQKMRRAERERAGGRG